MGERGRRPRKWAFEHRVEEGESMDVIHGHGGGMLCHEDDGLDISTWVCSVFMTLD